jgi:hypothetical protein
VHTPPSLSRLLLAQGIGLFRWSQTVPMVAMWASVWLILGALAFVNFQEEGVTLLTAVLAILERVPGLPDPSTIGQTNADGQYIVNDEALVSVVMSTWAALSLAGYLLGFALRAVRGERPPMPLKGKLLIALLLGVGTFAAFIVVFRNSTVAIQGPTSIWMWTFGALVAMALGASAYSLTVGHLLDRLVDRMLA